MRNPAADDLMIYVEHSPLADRQQVEMIERLGGVIGLRDPETGGHIRRVGHYAEMLTRAAGLDQETARVVGIAASLHDIGKVAIPDAILLKPGPLSVSEREKMRRHAQIGHDILADSGSSLLNLAAQISLTHQEHYDGSGYPAGLSGDEIPIAGRIVAVVDAFDSITSDRPYRQPRSPERALQILREGSGTQFDPELIDCLMENVDDFLTSGHRILERRGGLLDP